jgi:tRNA(Ile)-lysidine synthase
MKLFLKNVDATRNLTIRRLTSSTLVEREFEAAIENLGLSCRTRVLVAVSGGADSMALSYLAKQFFTSYAYAVTVDHRLRPESQAESLQVHEWLTSKLAFHHHTILTVDWTDKEIRDRSPSMRLAREKRYSSIAKYCRDFQIPYVLTAHHLNDQIETFLMRLRRESGLDGWACMRTQSDYPIACIDAWCLSLKVIRPLLNVPKERLLDFCREHDLPWITDPTNRNLTYQRNSIRFALSNLESSQLSLQAFRDMIHQFQVYRDETLHKGNMNMVS